MMPSAPIRADSRDCWQHATCRLPRTSLLPLVWAAIQILTLWLAANRVLRDQKRDGTRRENRPQHICLIAFCVATESAFIGIQPRGMTAVKAADAEASSGLAIENQGPSFVTFRSPSDIVLSSSLPLPSLTDQSDCSGLSLETVAHQARAGSSMTPSAPPAIVVVAFPPSSWETKRCASISPSKLRGSLALLCRPCMGGFHY
ncbi:hypothetical protein CPLU01_11084 [Colletotrichum plurivorum]|uniref:Uncharacterized protein n=1 Tax=Colletotrichum plurivorum TaxID=2175906 RepID=A0A8H6K3Y6_9PEZI|nr:hypothetical protein CPLU01_11084 [Colletotrichum plurivorum]